MTRCGASDMLLPCLILFVSSLVRVHPTMQPVGVGESSLLSNSSFFAYELPFITPKIYYMFLDPITMHVRRLWVLQILMLYYKLEVATDFIFQLQSKTYSHLIQTDSINTSTSTVSQTTTSRKIVSEILIEQKKRNSFFLQLLNESAIIDNHY